MGKLKDLTGQRFGKLIVVERAENQGNYTCWLCKCECGTLITVRSTNLEEAINYRDEIVISKQIKEILE